MFISHRVNTIFELLDTPSFMGVEVDLRDSEDEIIIAHDPFTSGERFSDYLKNYSHKFMILNIKSEKIELRVKKLLEEFGICNYFFLDSTLPMIVNYGAQPGFRFAVRVSEYESVKSAIDMRIFADWVWVDCFRELSISRQDFITLKNSGFKLCFVSPELHDEKRNILDFIQNLEQLEIFPDMVCSKRRYHNLWEKVLP